MAMAHLAKEASVALLFTCLYFALALWMAICYATGRYTFKSRWTILLFHTIVRVASQACGVAFGILAFQNTNVFIAYLILGAEGYFTLTVASYHFLKNWQIVNLGSSFLRPKARTRQEARLTALRIFTLQPLFMPWMYYKTEFLSIVESILLPANILIITGGAYLAASVGISTNLATGEVADHERIARDLRTAGSAMFYAMTFIFNLCLAKAFLDDRKYRKQGRTSRKGIHPTLIILAVVAFWLNIRGIFGVLQAAVPSLSYYSFENYNGEGFTSRFVAIEYCLTVLPEFSAAFLLNMTYFTQKYDVRVEDTDGLSLSDKKVTRTASKV